MCHTVNISFSFLAFSLVFFFSFSLSFSFCCWGGPLDDSDWCEVEFLCQLCYHAFQLQHSVIRRSTDTDAQICGWCFRVVMLQQYLEPSGYVGLFSSARGPYHGCHQRLFSLACHLHQGQLQGCIDGCIDILSIHLFHQRVHASRCQSRYANRCIRSANPSPELVVFRENHTAYRAHSHERGKGANFYFYQVSLGAKLFRTWTLGTRHDQ